jgi:hypothetical protein
MRIVARYEKGQRFLDLIKYTAKSLDEDGRPVYDECWECTIWENGNDANAHKTYEFASFDLAEMFINQNAWKEQVL